MYYIDAHCHIDRYPRPSDVLDAAARTRVVTIAVTETPAGFQALTVKAGRRPMLRVALGLHPLRAARVSRHELLLFSRLLERTDYIGEIGLDFSPQGNPSRQRQIEVFEQVLEAPGIDRKVLTVHSRRAEDATVGLLADRGAHAILHWYSGALKPLHRALDAGMWFSVNSAMLRTRNGQRILAALPRERVLTETDGPYTRQQGRPSDPSTIPMLVEALAEFWKEEPEATRQRLYDNMAALHAAATGHVHLAADAIGIQSVIPYEPWTMPPSMQTRNHPGVEQIPLTPVGGALEIELGFCSDRAIRQLKRPDGRL